jgi:hypothetical protein
VFSDFPDTAVASRVLFRLATDPDFPRCLVDRGHPFAHRHGACHDVED